MSHSFQVCEKIVSQSFEANKVNETFTWDGRIINLKKNTFRMEKII